MRNNKKLLGNSLLLLTAFIWGTAFAAQRNGMESIKPINYNAALTVFAAAAVGTGRAKVYFYSFGLLDCCLA